MICNKPCDFLKENDHPHNENDCCPEKHSAQIIPFHRTDPRAALLPESNSQQHDGKRQEPGPEPLHKRAHTRRPQRTCKSQGKTAPYRCQRAHNRSERCRDAGALPHLFSPLRGLHRLILGVHFFLVHFKEASILFLNSLALAIAAGSSTVSNFLSRITTRPPMITV